MNVGNSQGARDGDPIAMLLLIFMAIVLLAWLGNSSFSPWTSDIGCSTQNPPPATCNETIASGFQNGMNTLNNTGFLTLFIPLGVVMFMFYIYREFTGEDVEDTYGQKFQNEPRRYRRPQQEEEQDESDEGGDEA